MKIMICLGTRPEIIKMSTILTALKKLKQIQCIVCLSGQHRELAESAAKELGVGVDYNFNIMKKEQSLQYILATITENLARVIRQEKPDYIMVHGDTSTCFASAVCAFYEQIPVIYVEAGWRSGNIAIPFPEEMHRQLVSKLAKYFFCSTKNNYDNLILEKNEERNIFIVGNPIIDVLKQTIREDYIFSDQIINDNLQKKIVLITFHRRENKEKLYELFDIVCEIARENKEVVFLWIAHPSVWERLNDLNIDTENVNVLKPLCVYDMHNLIYRSSLVMTDSGGIQEEAYLLKKNTIILRSNIERTELLNEFSVLSEVNLSSIKKYIENFLRGKNTFHIEDLPKELVGEKVSKIIQEVVDGKFNN